MRPEQYQPPLRPISHLWRLALMLLISGLALGSRADFLWDEARWWLFGDLALGCVSYVVIWWRRRFPVAITTFLNIVATISSSSTGPAALALVSLSTRRRWREIIPQAVLSVACGLIGVTYVATPAEQDDPLLVSATFVVAFTAVLIAWGMYIGSRRELLASWRERALSSEAEQQAKVDQARSVERARIAREMHDVLAHRISVVSMTAGALAYRTDLSTDEVRATAKTIQETSHLALTELREVLGVLREGPGDADPEDPQRRTADLAELIEECRAAGMRVHYHCDADLAGLPAAVARTLYRCAQEALTNARKHAPASLVTVRVSGVPGEGINLLVENALPVGTLTAPAPVSGFGLVGVAERVALSGGRQSATVTDDKRFVLHVWLPWQP